MGFEGSDLVDPHWPQLRDFQWLLHVLGQLCCSDRGKHSHSSRFGLVDFARSWSETCLENWEQSSASNFWQQVSIGSTALMYAFTIILTGLLYTYFTGLGCTLKHFFILFNLGLCILITLMSIHPAIQEADARSGLAQSAMAAAYCSYLVVSALSTHVIEAQTMQSSLRRQTDTENCFFFRRYFHYPCYCVLHHTCSHSKSSTRRDRKEGSCPTS